MTTKKRVLVLTSTFPRWEGDKEPPFVFELCRRLGDSFDILVLAPHAPGAKRFERVDGIDIVRFRYFIPRWERLAYQGGILANLRQNRWRYFLLPFYFLAQFVALLRILKSQRIDVIHAHWLIPQGLTVSLAGMFVKNMPPVMCTSHGGDLLGLNGWPLNLVKKWVIRQSSMLTVVSHAMADYALSLGAKAGRLATIPMGVDTKARFTPDAEIQRANNEILFTGRLVEKKGVTYLLDAMPIILKQYPNARLSIVGDGPEADSLMQQVERLCITHAVTFYGSVSNSELPELYRRAAILVAPSIITAKGDQEGLGLVLVEALACECPVVASDLPAIRDVIFHGETGWLAPQKDPDALASAVVRFLKEPELGRTLAVTGRSHAMQNFDWTFVTKRYKDLLFRLAWQESSPVDPAN